MFFDSTIFVLFLIVVVGAYWRMTFRTQNLFLLAMSYLFYGWWDYRFLLLMGSSTIINFIVSHKFDDDSLSQRSRRRLVFVAVALNLSFLGFFKYFNFFIDSFANVWTLVSSEPPPRRLLEILLPPGISFYTFQEIAYVVDVYKRHIRPAGRLLDYALFVSVFPHLIAGPIQRPDHLLPQLEHPRRFDSTRFFDGLMLILEGLFRKIVIADNCALVANAAFDGKLGAQGSTPIVVLGVVAFAWQIYGDFSGYSSIARGAAQLLGLHFMLNFKQPYLATSLQDFWRRWHMSLSGWLRDYLYIPLGGSRRGEKKTYRNLLTTMLLGGLWHGANWTFVIWGFIHGAGLALERFLGIDIEGRLLGSVWLKRVFMFVLVSTVWIYFRAPSTTEATRFLLSGLHPIGSTPMPVLVGATVFLLLFSVPLFCLDLRLESKGEEYALQSLTPHLRVAFGLGLLFCIFLFGANQSSAFIYFQF